MALIASSTSKSQLNPSLICLSFQNKAQTTALCFKARLPISKNSIPQCLTSKTKTPRYKNTRYEKGSKRTKSSANPIPELESYSHRIWWSKVEVKRPKNVFVGRKWDSLDIGTLSVVVIMHGLALFAPFAFNWGAFWVAVVLYFVTGLLGICLSFHRNLSLRSFKLPKWLEYFFAYCGVLALQGNPIDWVSTHRYHHQFCDSEQDPHSPLEGFWFSHMNWLFDHRAIIEKCGERSNVGDLEKQSFYRFIRSTYVMHPFILGFLLYALGGFPYLVWSMGVRSIWVYHITWFVNSACHVWGNQTWNTRDLSRNNWWVALLSFGEGWHNNHHTLNTQRGMA